MATLGTTLPHAHHRSNRIAELLTRDWHAGLAAATILAFLFGLLSAFLVPRGPVIAENGLLVMGIGLAVGVLTGILTGRAWAIVPVGLAYLVALELGRIDASGPTLDMIRLDNTFGLMAVAFSRGLHGVLLLVPMLFGTALGLRLRPAFDGRRGGLPIGTTILGAATLGLALLVTMPASTPPILGSDGQPVPGSIAELVKVDLNGSEQTVMIRAADPDNPVLLYLSGGPGQSDFGYSRPISSVWDDDVVFVDWDQRGNGNSYPAIEPMSEMTLDNAVADTIALTEYLTERFGEERIYVMGESWGTLLGVLAVQQRPDLYHAYIGSGQMVNIRETDRRIYEDLVAYATRTGNTELATTLAGFGAPPYKDFPLTNAMIWGYYDYIYESYTPSETYRHLLAEAAPGFFGLAASEYDLINKANAVRGLFDTFAIMYPQVYDVDLRSDAPRLEVPVWILDGAAELDGRRDLALDWAASLDAPSKHVVTYDDAAHSVAFEQVDAVHRLLTEEILPATYGR
jgi:proline iminopeptidase